MIKTTKLYWKGHEFYKAYEEKCWELNVEPRFKTLDEFNDAHGEKMKELGRTDIIEISGNKYRRFMPGDPFTAAKALAKEQVK